MRSCVHLAYVLTLAAGTLCAAADPTVSGKPDSLATLGASAAADSSASPPEYRVVVYYFHRTMRCSSCLSLEAMTAKGLVRFSAEREQGTLAWRPLNLDEPENEHFVDDFDLSFNTVVIAREERGVQTSWRSLGERPWDLLEDEDELIAFVGREVESYLQAD